MNNVARTTRRKVLKVLGAGAVGSVLLSGSASAEKSFGNGNGIGAFLNDKAELKKPPIWDDGISDQRGEGTVEVEVGTLTSMVPPFEEGPFAFAPRVVKVSPGTTVKWVWTGNPWESAPPGIPVPPGAPWPHDVASLEKIGGTYKFASDMFLAGNDKSFEYTFEEVGTNLYFCHPHGYPFHDNSGFDYNLVGMRGAVLVRDD
ncbi:plastocyanin/azurin family copper-binding protein [Haladaptatus sp. ZSTT2]|uniref:plastocyanin/azurin family copper-binding protein n=1 Tax=Haladaptatus sp. ZSTT2 TaxID=3120515 RepID=UPI00300EC04B